jgi:hypothetical protein
MEKSSIVYSFLVRAHNLQLLRIEQGSTPRIDRSIFATLLLLLSQTQSVVHWAFLVSLLITVDYLDRWAPSSLVSRSYIAMTSLHPRFPQPYSRRRDPVNWPCRAPCCLHQIPDWVNWPLQPASVIKWNHLTGTADTKAHFPSKFGSITVLFLLPPTSIPSSKLFFCVRFRRQEEAQSRLKAEINPSCHPWLRLQKSSSRFAGHC